MSILNSTDRDNLTNPTAPHAIKGLWVSFPPTTPLATARVNMMSIPDNLALLTLDTLAGAWGDVKAGYTLWVGTSAGAYDIGIYRIRGVLDGNDLPIAEMNLGDSGLARLTYLQPIVNDAYVTVIKDVALWAVKSRISYPDGGGVGTTYKDYDLAWAGETDTAAPCRVNIGQHRAGWVNTGTGLLTLDFAMTAYPFGSATVASILWDMDGGTITVGSATSSTLTATFTAGHYLISCTVTLSNGAVMRVFRHVFAHAPVTYPPLPVPATSVRLARNGASASLQLAPNADLSTLAHVLHGTFFLLWQESTVALVEGQYQYPLWVNSASGSIAPRLLITSTFEGVSALQIGDTIPALSQILDEASTPATWQQADRDLMTLEFWVFYLGWYHFTLFQLLDSVFEGDVWRGFTLPGYSAGFASLTAQLTQAIARLTPAQLTQDPNGTLRFGLHPSLISNDARAALAERVTLTQDETETAALSLRTRPLVHRAEVLALATGGVTLTAVRSMAFGTVGGQGTGEPRLQNQVVTNQTECNQQAGWVLARENTPYESITLTSPFDWGIVLWPSQLEWIRLTFGAAFWPTQAAFNQRCILREVIRDIQANGYVRNTLVFEVETNAPAGKTMPIYLGNGLDDTDYTSPVSFDPNGLIIPPLDGYGGLLQGTDWGYWTPDPTEYSAPDSGDAGDDPTYAIAWTAEDIAWTLTRSAPSVAWTVLFSLMDTLRYVLPRTLTTAPIPALSAYTLTDVALNYYSNILSGSSTPTQTQAISDVTLGIRNVAGVAGAVAVLVGEQTVGDWEYTIDFSVDDGLFVPRLRFGASNGAYAGTYWTSSDVTELYSGGRNYYDIIAIFRPLPPFTLRGLDVEYAHIWSTYFIANGYNFAGFPAGDFGIWRPTDIFTDQYLNFDETLQSATPITATYNLSPTETADRIRLFMLMGNAGDPNPPNPTLAAQCFDGYANIYSITVRGTGFNPFEDRLKLLYVTGNGVTVTEIPVTLRGADTGFDVDDFNLGIVVVAAMGQLWFSQTYTGDDFGVLAGFSFLPAADEQDAWNDSTKVNITSVRIPYRQVNSGQALNNDRNDLHLLVATDNEPTAGGTLWRIRVDVDTLALLEQVDMTPTVLGDTYYVVSADAMETSGADTQKIRILGRILGGGDQVKCLMTNDAGDGGATWEIISTLDDTADYLKIKDNDTLFMVASDDSLWVSDADGETLTEATGDYDIGGMKPGVGAWPL